MIKNYFKHAVRNLSRNRLISFINILGLSAGLTLIIHLTLFIKSELSYDRFHDKHDRIYRILTKYTEPTGGSTVAICQGHLPEVIAGIPQVEKCVRVYGMQQVDIEFNRRRLINNPIIYADSTFFDMFSFKLLSGTPEILKDPNSIIISRSLAIKAFNTADVTGRVIKAGDKDYTIGGVLEDVPSNSHLQFDILCGFNEPFLDNLVEHSGNEFYTYVLLRKNIDSPAALKMISNMYGSFLSNFNNWKNRDIKYEGVTQPLADIRLHSDDVVWDVPHGNLHDIRLATGLILFILIIAILNFINLVTVSAEARLKEVGIRKMSGASRIDMIRQYMGEAVIIALASMLLAFIFAAYTGPYVNGFTGKNIPGKELLNPLLVTGLTFLTAIVGIISGVYPALYLSRCSISGILKGSVSKTGQISTFIRGLVLSQFTIVIFLVTCMLVFYKQVNYIKSKNLGFDKEYVVEVKGLNKNIYNSYELIRQNLLKNGGIESVCLAQGINADDLSGQYAYTPGQKEDNEILVRHTRTTPGFVEVFKLNILEGRDFDVNLASDKKNFIINETAVKALGFKGSAIDQPLVMNDSGHVIGVVKDYNFASLHNKIDPLIITLNDLKRGVIFVRLKSFYIHDGLEFIDNTIKSADPLYTLDYEFVDDSFNAMYRQEERMSKILSLTTGISILLAFMGLIALTSFIIIRRVKEIGVRKINGATVSEILVLLNKNYAKWIAIAFFIAAPVARIVMKNWLDGFAYKAALNWWIFALSGLFAFAVSLSTVSLICWKAANRNPVEALKYE